MKLYDIVMAATQDTQIRLVLKMYGVRFCTKHSAEYFLDCEEINELLDRTVTDIRTVDNLLEVTLQ